MVKCGITNLATCLPQKFFEFIIKILNVPIKLLSNLSLDLLSEPIDLSLFLNLWVIIVYMLSMFYALLLIASGFNFIISGYDSEKRENAKKWLRNIVIMIVLVQSSFFIYQLAIDLSSIMTSATLSLIDSNFFLINIDDGLGNIGLALIFYIFYASTLLITSLILIMRYAFVSVGVALVPIAIFLYFLPPLKQYGSLILNFLGIIIFVTFFDAILLIGFSKLVNIGILSSMKILVLISAFAIINLVMLFLMFFSIVKAGFSVYSDVKGIKGKL